MDKLIIKKTEPLYPNISINVPSSKSLSNRALILNVISGNKISIQNLSKSGDTRLLNDILKDYLQNDGSSYYYNCKDAGTVFRFLTAFFSFQNGEFVLSGHERMKQRPHSALFHTLKDAGVNLRFLELEGKPPVKITGKKPQKPLSLKIDGSKSSQFITALLLTGPEYGLTLQINRKKVSGTYISMTLALFDQMDIQYQFITPNTIFIPQQQIARQQLFIESDWSSAAPWYVLTAFQEKEFALTINGLNQNSIQGDKRLAEIFASLGVKTIFQNDGITIINQGLAPINEVLQLDLTDTPDLFPYILTTCAGLNMSCTIKGIAHLKYKESDRIAAITSELSKMNNTLKTINSNTVQLQKNKSRSSIGSVVIDPHHDHRIAMAFAPMALIKENIEIMNPYTVNKSYPAFWNELKKTGLHLISKP